MAKEIIWTSTPTGRDAWKVTGYSQIKTLMEDRRLAMEHPDPAAQQWYTDSPMHRVLVRLAARPVAPGESDHEERARRRASMTKMFSPQNVRHALPDVQRIASELVEEMAELPQPTDLARQFSIPLCARVVCALLDVPVEDSLLFRHWADEKDQADMRRSMMSLKQLMDYVKALIKRRVDEPGNDIVSVLLADGGPDALSVGRITNLVAWILGLGWQVAASAIDFGVLQLISHPDQLELLLADPSLAEGATEEVLRHFNATSAAIGGLDRYAHADIEMDGASIKAGDMVLLDVPTANHDPEIFPRPAEFDILRSPNPHLTFGHGFYFCNFNRVARSEVEVGISTIFRRFPQLALAVPPEQLSYKEHPQSGLVSLPVTW
jgi:cytochrome P450